MAPFVVTQLVFLLLVGFEMETSATPQSGYISLSCPDILSPKSTAPCLVEGKSTTRREEYISTPGVGTHRIHPGLATWNAARRICEEQGSHPVIPNSVAEAKAIGQMLTKSGGSHAWTGIHDLYQEDEFITIHIPNI